MALGAALTPVDRGSSLAAVLFILKNGEHGRCPVSRREVAVAVQLNGAWELLHAATNGSILAIRS